LQAGFARIRKINVGRNWQLATAIGLGVLAADYFAQKANLTTDEHG
jgi:hypothetical protein